MKIKIILRKLSTTIRHPRLAAAVLWQRMSRFIISDRLFLKVLYRLRTGRALNLERPTTYNEKLQWLKLNYRNPLQIRLVDKFEAKKYVVGLIGSSHVIPTLGIWSTFNEIDFNLLPNQFVLKTTHDQGGVIICRDKRTLELNKAREKLEYHLRRQHYYLSREWPYKNVEPRILAEELIVDEGGIELMDYKFFCFDGVPKALFIATDRQKEDVKFDFFDTKFNHLNITQVHNQSKRVFRRPKNYEDMLRLASILSKGLPHVRVDFYNVDGNIYFGEFTFFHHGGLNDFYPDEWNDRFGQWLNLPTG